MTTEDELKKLLEADLKKLVTLHAKWDATKKAYVPEKLDQAALLNLGDLFYKLLDKQLLADGAEATLITKRNKKLVLYFHMDKKAQFFPEVTWLEANLSEGKNDGTCFRILSERHTKLITPEKVQPVNFNNIKTKNEFRVWLQHQQMRSTSYSSRSFCSSLLALYDESSSFFDEVGKIKPKALKTLVGFIPMVFASYGTIICGQELFALYALYFVLLKGGQKVEQTDFIGAYEVGKTLQDISKVGAAVTAVFMMRLLEMTFWVSHRSLKASLKIGAAIITPMLSATPPVQAKPASHSNESWRKDLILAKQDASEGTKYQTPELKLISLPVETCKSLLEKQWGLSMRPGAKKLEKVKAFLFNLRVIDKGKVPLQAKLTAVKTELDKLKADKVVYDSTTAAAVDCAEEALFTLMDPEEPTTQLVVVEQPAAKLG